MEPEPKGLEDRPCVDGPCVGRGPGAHRKATGAQAKLLATAKKRQGSGGILKALKRVDPDLPEKWYNTMRAKGWKKKDATWERREDLPLLAEAQRIF